MKPGEQQPDQPDPAPEIPAISARDPDEGRQFERIIEASEEEESAFDLEAEARAKRYDEALAARRLRDEQEREEAVQHWLSHFKEWLPVRWEEDRPVLDSAKMPGDRAAEAWADDPLVVQEIYRQLRERQSELWHLILGAPEPLVTLESGGPRFNPVDFPPKLQPFLKDTFLNDETVRGFIRERGRGPLENPRAQEEKSASQIVARPSKEAALAEDISIDVQQSWWKKHSDRGRQ
jgi:hypothetical protein